MASEGGRGSVRYVAIRRRGEGHFLVAKMILNEAGRVCIFDLHVLRQRLLGLVCISLQQVIHSYFSIPL